MNPVRYDAKVKELAELLGSIANTTEKPFDDVVTELGHWISVDDDVEDLYFELIGLRMKKYKVNSLVDRPQEFYQDRQFVIREEPLKRNLKEDLRMEVTQ